jgi:hypothetical protein
MKRALIVSEPWVSKILAGEKRWELRTRPTLIRGQIGIIRKGSSQIVGSVEIVKSPRAALTLDEMMLTSSVHGVPEHQVEMCFQLGWRYPWVIENAERFDTPVSYIHPRGCVTWVLLAPQPGVVVEGD